MKRREAQPMSATEPTFEGQEMDFNEVAKENFKTWNAALATGDAQVVAQLYTDRSTFLPTLSRDFKKGQAGAEEYFLHFLQKKPVGRVTEEEVEPLGPFSYLHSGKYEFTVGPDEKREEVSARFSYVWKQNKEGEWKIVHHHSSLEPE